MPVDYVRTLWPGGSWMTRKEAASYMRMSERNLDRLIKTGRIDVARARPGCTVWINVRSCNKYLNIDEELDDDRL